MLRCMMRRKSSQGPRPSGHDVLLSVRDGHLARPPAASLLDLAFEEVAPGRVVLGFRPSRRFADGTTVPGGVLAGVADIAMTTAVRTTVLAATDVVSSVLTVEHLHPVSVDSGPLRCEGSVLDGTVVEGTRAQATITDPSGRVVLRAEATCRVVPAIAA
jgi:acyl-coenzyme A thioesterase PaaI-like protein